jgi:hypothetical protein
MKANYPRQRFIPDTRLRRWHAMLACVGIVATGALAVIGWILLALLGY